MKIHRTQTISDPHRFPPDPTWKSAGALSGVRAAAKLLKLINGERHAARERRHHCLTVAPKAARSVSLVRISIR
jgi:hypothetical protein